MDSEIKKDSEGNRIVRDYEDRNLWVERVTDEKTLKQIYAFRTKISKEGPLGDSVCIREAIYSPNGERISKHYRDGLLHKEKGWAIQTRSADEVYIEEYYLNGEKL